MDSRHLLAIAIIFATLVGAWKFRYESIMGGGVHRNRFTGAVRAAHAGRSALARAIRGAAAAAARPKKKPRRWRGLRGNEGRTAFRPA
jgi:hypothetical protein